MRTRARLLVPIAGVALVTLIEAPSPSFERQTEQPVAPVVFEQPPASTDSGPVQVYRDGRHDGTVPGSEARQRGLTVLDLGDTWTPRVLSDDDRDASATIATQPYRDRFLALADERFGSGAEWASARGDRYFELYGIFPTLRVVRARLLDDARHACHASVDDAPLVVYTRVLRPSFTTVARDAQTRAPRSALVTARRNAVRALQSHLVCDGLLSSSSDDGTYGMRTMTAVRTLARKHVLVSTGVLDEDARVAMLAGSAELDFRTLLRMLRERVADASGLIEDGTAACRSEPVLGRVLDPRQIAQPRSCMALDDAAPDLVAQATEAAARALGWTSPETAHAWLAHLPDGATRNLRVAVALPPPPSYHSATMVLRAEIDRADVDYHSPRSPTGVRYFPRTWQRPTLVLYAEHEGRTIALVRWSTTIGGWKRERLQSGRVVLQYKESPIGRRVWRDLVSSPAWIPPATTPPEDMLVHRPRGWSLDRELFGPSYRSAYGLMMLVHQRPVSRDGDAARYVDEGVRTHGSVSYRSIQNGESHGCHRLFNHLAVRLGSFLLAHRAHSRVGAQPVRFVRDFRHQGARFRLSLTTRGYLFRLEPPIVVDVLPGTAHGRRPRLLASSTP